MQKQNVNGFGWVFFATFGDHWLFLTTFGCFWPFLAILGLFFQTFFWLVFGESGHFSTILSFFCLPVAPSGCPWLSSAAFDRFQLLFISRFGHFWSLFAIFGQIHKNLDFSTISRGGVMNFDCFRPPKVKVKTKPWTDTSCC